MNQNSLKRHTNDKPQATPAHPAGIKPTEQDAQSRMTGEGNVQNSPPQDRPTEGGQGSGQGRGRNAGKPTERKDRSKRADAGVIDGE